MVYILENVGYNQSMKRRTYVRSRDSSIAVIYLRAPGWLKNEMAEHAHKRGYTLTSWALNILKEALDEERGLAPPPPPVAPVPSPQQVVRGYITGESAMEPCGREAPCERVDSGTHSVGDLEYCNFCRVRVK